MLPLNPPPISSNQRPSRTLEVILFLGARLLMDALAAIVSDLDD